MTKVSQYCHTIVTQWFIWILLNLWITNGEREAPRSITIGGIFEEIHEGSELAFKHAVEKVNSRQDLLRNIKLSYDINRCPPQDSFTADRQVCQQLKGGVAAVFGPMSALSASHVQSICDAMEIPHVTTRWDYSENKDFFSINLFPDYSRLSKAFIDFMLYNEWTTFFILYERDDGLAKLQDLLLAQGGQPFTIAVQKLEPQTQSNGKLDYRPVLKEVRNSGVKRIVLDCDYTIVRDILYQAMTINMTSQYYHYLLTTLDADLIDLEDFKYSDVNITSMRMIDPTRPEVIEVIREWEFQQTHSGKSPLESKLGYGFRTEAALMYDAVHLFAKALDQLSEAQPIEIKSLSCNKANPWDKGSSLINYMKMTDIQGLTGHVNFDGQSKRQNFALEITELARDGMTKIGWWNTTKGINVTRDFAKDLQSNLIGMKNKTLIVTSILEDPYMMEKDDFKNRQGNDRYEGYCVDLLKEIASIVNFTYELKMVGDGKYGSPEGESQEWTGMVRELMDEKADLAVASLTISYVREKVVDFTKPYMNLGISILFQKPRNKNPSLFSFLAPLSFEIWVYMLAAYLVVSLLLFVLARFSPYEWYNPHPCNPDSDVVENQFTLMNSFWFTIGSLMQQGSEVAPRAMSTRIISGIWWFFTLIMISSYTANLAAFLTVERMTSPIENADDLSKQTDIRYGCVWGGSTMTFFKASEIETFKRMWTFMESAKPSVFVNSTPDGIAKVKQGKYAYLLESTMNEYSTQRDCELMQVGGFLDSKGYGIGTPRGSKIRDVISDAILKLAEDQILQRLYNKWWKEKGGAGQCESDDSKKDASSLAIANVGGVFVVLLAGLALSLVVGVLEFVYKAQKNADRDKVKQSVCTEMARELRFAVKCGGSATKPAKPRPAPPPPDMVDGNGMALAVPETDYSYTPTGYSKVPTQPYIPSKEYYT